MTEWRDRPRSDGYGEARATEPVLGSSPAARGGEALAGVLRTGLAPVLLLALVPYGATGPFANPAATFAVALWSCLAFALCRSVRMPVAATLLIVLVLAGWVVAQAMPDPLFLPPHPIWREAAERLGRPLAGTVSVAPERTLAALPALVGPFLMFAAVLLLFRADRQAIGLLRFLATVGTAVAAFAIVQHFAFPDMVLWSRKTAYRDSLTAVFANRNTAATFLGCTALLLMGLAARTLAGRPALPALLVMMIEPGKARREWRLAVTILALFVVTLALFLTKSRAGVASTLVSASILALLLQTPRGYRRPRRRVRLRGGSVRWFGASAVVVALFGGALLVFGGQTLRRVSLNGFDDARFCVLPGIWRAARDAWPLGTGAGTFDIVFPAYRDPACGIYWVWDRAHNVFLEGLVTLGAPFAAICLLAYGVLLPVLARGLRERRRERFAPAVGLAVLLLLTLHDILDFSVQIPGMAVFASALMAGTVAIASSTSRESRSHKSS